MGVTDASGLVAYSVLSTHTQFSPSNLILPVWIKACLSALTVFSCTPRLFSKFDTVFGRTSAMLANSRTVQFRAALAILHCIGVINDTLYLKSDINIDNRFPRLMIQRIAKAIQTSLPGVGSTRQALTNPQILRL